MASSRNSSESFAHVEKPPVTSIPHSLSKAVYARRAEYIRPRKIRLKIGSWNVAACPGTDKDLAGWFIQGKGVDPNLSGLKFHDDGSQIHIQSVGEQEERRRKKNPTIPQGDEGIVPGDSDIDLYVLGLQEIVDLASVTEYVGKVYVDPGPMAKWRNAFIEALPAGYQIVSEQQLSGLLLMIGASPELAPSISSVSSVSVGTGIMGYLGNKGAVTTRIVIGETTRLVFINSHLASGTDPGHLERRCWDVQQILQRTHFDPISWAGVLDDAHESIGTEDFAFWFGDLNFRLDKVPGDDIRRLLMLHTRGEYNVGDRSRKKIDKELDEDEGPFIIHSIESADDSEDDNPRASNSFDQENDDSSNTLPDPEDFVQDPSQDPISLEATFNSLLPHDQLRHVQKAKKAFHDGWREGPITFLPTYKYDVGSMGVFDTSEKKRSPSWCDRILFRTRRDKLEYDGHVQEAEVARLKDQEMKSRGIDEAGDEESVLFDYNPDEDGEDSTRDAYDEYDDAEPDIHPEPVVNKEGFVDKIQLGLYTSHQRVLSSDHKPLDAIFTLEYDGVVPELKSKVQQEIARELDRAENEGRPDVTIVVEPSFEKDVTESEPNSPRSSTSGAGEGINFGYVSFHQRKTRNLTIANTSQVVSKFAFVDRPSASDGNRVTPSWLRVSFPGAELDEEERRMKHLECEVVLQPGDAVNATMETFVDDFSLVRSLNECSAKLEDVLVVRVTDGRDHFLPVHATWLQSCFGRSVDELIRFPKGGVRALYPSKRKHANGAPINRCQDVCWSAPRELFKLTEAVDALIDRVIADANMIDSAKLPQESAGWPFDEKAWLLKDSKARELRIHHVIQALDSDTNLIVAFPSEIPAIERIEIVSEVLLLFLSSLKDGIVTPPLWTQLEQDISSRGGKQLSPEEIKTWVLDVLSSSPNHNISFVFLTTMLCRVAGELAPTPKSPTPSVTETTKSSFDSVRKSLNWKSQQPAPTSDPAVARRQAVTKAFAEIFSRVIFRGPVPVKEKERRLLDERRRDIVEAFLQDCR